MRVFPTVRQLVDSLKRGEVLCEEVVAAALAAAEGAGGATEEGAGRIFIRVNHDALDQAVRIDRARHHGEALPALAGAPISLKDLFNIQGQQTLAGSVALRDEAPIEKADAVVVGHLRAAGALFIGRANMSEFAFSGMGLNPHYGSPKNAWDRATGRLPGGSSSGSAVSIAEGIVPASLGSDTAGSCRIPAAFNGVVGVKPTYGRVSLRGVYPLSPSSDAPGPLANDVDGCFILDHIIMGRLKHGQPLPIVPTRAPKSLRLAVPECIVMQGLDEAVATAFGAALKWLEEDGVAIKHGPFPALDGCVALFDTGAVAVFEAWQAHAERLRQRGHAYDPFVRRRLHGGASVNAETRQRIYRRKAELTADFRRQFFAARAHALIYPTVQCIPPAVAETALLEDMPKVNFKCLRNTSTVNNFDGCAISLPCHLPGNAPVGLMLAAGHGDDQRLYEIAAAVERSLNARRHAG